MRVLEFVCNPLAEYVQARMCYDTMYFFYEYPSVYNMYMC